MSVNKLTINGAIGDWGWVGVEIDKLDILVSNDEDIIDYFLSLANEYGWGRFSFRVNTSTVANNIFRLVEQILLGDIQNQSHEYFGLQGIGNVNQVMPKYLIVSALTPLSGSNVILIQHFNYRVQSDVIAKAIEGQITNTNLEKLRIDRREN